MSAACLRLAMRQNSKRSSVRELRLPRFVAATSLGEMNRAPCFQHQQSWKWTMDSDLFKEDSLAQSSSLLPRWLERGEPFGYLHVVKRAGPWGW